MSAAARVIARKDDVPSRVARWKLSLLNRSKASEQILDELVASGRQHVRVGDERPVHDAITYLTNNAERMD